MTGGLSWLASTMIALSPLTAAAQQGERTGQRAAPATPPAYPQPAPDLALPAPTSAPPSPSPSADRGMVTLDSLAIAQPDTDQSATNRAIAPRTAEDSSDGITVSVAAKEAMDATWIDRQFRRNQLIGQPVPLDRIVTLVQRLNLLYARSGFVNSGLLILPQQLAPDAPQPLKLRLILGTLASGDPVITWKDGLHHGLNDRFIRSAMPALNRVPLDAAALERDFRLLAEDPAIRTVAASLTPGAAPGEAHLSLAIVPQRAFDMALSFANNRAPSVGGERAGLDISLRNILGPGDLISLSGGLTERQPDLSGSWTAPLFGRNTGIVLRGAWNRAAVVDAPLLPLDISSRDWMVEGGLTQRLVHRPLMPAAGDMPAISARDISIGLLLTRRVSRSYLLGQPFSFSPGALHGRAAYSAARMTLDWAERSSNSVWVLALTGTMGLSGTRSDVEGVVNPGRHFTTGFAQLSHARRLADNGLELRARIVAQLSDGAIYAGERFAIGGENSVRGYRETAQLTDEGLFGSVELAQPFSLTGGRKGALGMDWGSFTASTFADAARGHNRDGQAQAAPRTLYSIGASLVWTPAPALSARITYGHALRAAPIVGSRDIQDHGLQFRLIFRPMDVGR